MEADGIARRIRQVRDIEIAMDESGEGRTPLTDALRNAIPFMTPEEIRETLFRTLDKLDELYGDKTNVEELLRKEREAHERDIANIRNEIAAKDRALAVKDSEIARLKKELAESKASNTDANHKVSSMNKDKFQGTSKKGIDKSHSTSKGRDDNKDDFDGTPESAAPDDNAGKSMGSTGSPKVDKISKDKSEIEAEKKATRGNYTLADAQEKIFYECDLSLVPEGAEIIGQSTETVFDEIRILRAIQYGMVTYRIKESYVDEDGNIAERWVEHTRHFRRVGDNDSKADGHTERPGEIAEYENGHMPNQVPDTKLTTRMLAMLIFQHLGSHVAINRISHVFKEFGFKVRRSTLGEWLEKGAAMFEEAHKKLLDRILADNAVTYCDETWERLHLKDITKKVYTWIIGNKVAKSVAYVYDDGSRGRDVLVNLLRGRNIKAMHTDGYTAYYYLQALCIIQICCGAHVWRKIKEWYELTGDPDARCLLLDLQWLFIQDAKLKEDGAHPEEVLRRRKSAETTEVITRFEARLEVLKTKLDSLPKKGRTAVNYAINTQSKLFRWREDADFELDNNFAERAARPVALSRKTSLHNCSHHGAKARAILRSFIETCKLQGIGIVRYMTDYFNAVCTGRADYENLLPATIGIVR